MVFDLQTGECLHVLPGHSATVVAAVITRKNRCTFSVLCTTSLHSAELVETCAFPARPSAGQCSMAMRGHAQHMIEAPCQYTLPPVQICCDSIPGCNRPRVEPAC